MYLIKWNGSAWAGADGTAGIYPLPLGSSTVHGGAGLSLDASGNPHVAWWESGARSYYLKWSGSAWVDADGTGIESAMILDQNMEAASLALDSAGNPNIAFIGDPVQKSLNMIKWNGSSWVDLDGIGLESMVVFTSTKYVIMPVLKLDGMDRPHIMFLEHNLLNQTPFYYLQWNGSAWVDADGSGTESALVSIPENTGVGSGLGDAMWLDSVGRPYISASNQGIINIIRWNGSAWSDLDGVGRESLKQVVFPYSGGNGPNLSVLKILSGKIHVLLDPGQKEVYYMQYTCMPAVPVPSFTNTLTATQTPAVMTGSPTATFTNTPVFTPTITPTRQAGPLAFNSCGLYPNPFNYVTDAFLNIAIGLSRTDIDGLTLEIYTPAFRKVREKRLNSADAYLAAASRLMQYDAANLKGLASGVYYYMVKAELGGVTARSKADVLILIR
jgi:hypothetical protein